MADDCLCCGESTLTIGICRACVVADCDPRFSSACERTGETYVPEWAVPESERPETPPSEPTPATPSPMDRIFRQRGGRR